LCAGYGGIELGLKRVIANLRSVALCEIEAYACANLVAKMEAGLMEPAPIWTDLKTFPWESFRDRVDILTGGYPCQPFSAAGKRLGTEDPRHLWPYIASGIRLLRPKLCFFENVEGHISLGLREVIGELEQMGYKVSWGIFSAREVGAPHQRKRVFIMAHLKCEGLEGLYNWNSPSEQTQLVGADSGSGCQRSAWPSRPGEAQHGWEPPRVVGNSTTEGLQGCGTVSEVDRESRGTESEGSELAPSAAISSDAHGREVLGNSIGIHEYKCSGRESEQLESWDASEAMGNAAEQGCEGSGRTNDPRWTIDRPTESNGGCAYGAMEQGERQTEPPLGGDADGPAGGMDYAELQVTCDNRTDELRLLGNGVVPATAERAFRTLLEELNT
jgi:DNA (cytosine-5)-methyltransferase 1